MSRLSQWGSLAVSLFTLFLLLNHMQTSLPSCILFCNKSLTINHSLTLQLGPPSRSLTALADSDQTWYVFNKHDRSSFSTTPPTGQNIFLLIISYRFGQESWNIGTAYRIEQLISFLGSPISTNVFNMGLQPCSWRATILCLALTLIKHTWSN